MSRAQRALNVVPKYIQYVKSTFQKSQFSTQKEFAESLKMSLATVNNFFNGKRTDREYFQKICNELGLDWQVVAGLKEDSQISSSDRQILPNYIERPPIEDRCLANIVRPGSMTRIKAAHGMGKTELIKNLQSCIDSEQYRTVRLDLLLAENGTLQGIKEFLYWFCGAVCRELQIPNELDEYWEEGLGNTYSCTIFFEEYILGKFEKSLVLFLDNVDRLFDTWEIHEQITKDFFKMLRAWHEKSTSRDIWNNLRMILSYSTEDYSLLDINCSPFNVGMMVELPEFTLEQVQALAKRQNLDLEVGEIEELLQAIGGHPKLIQQAFKSLKNQEQTLTALLKTAHTEAGIYSNHLRKCLRILQKYPELGEAMKKITETHNPIRIDSILVFKLQGLGLIKIAGNYVQSRCQLYNLYFQDRL